MKKLEFWILFTIKYEIVFTDHYIKIIISKYIENKCALDLINKHTFAKQERNKQQHQLRPASWTKHCASRERPHLRRHRR